MGIYEAYYSCRQEPFSQSPDPRFLYLAPSHREALAQLRYTVESGKGFAVLTGEVGTGKTTLLRSLLTKLGPRVRPVCIFNRPRTIDDLYAMLASELGLSPDGGARPIIQLAGLVKRLAEAGGRMLIVLDEAQGLSFELLEEVRLLSNLETATDKLVQIILAGQPEFDEMLDSNDLRALRQRVVLRHCLVPLGLQDTVQYVANRLRVAGASQSPFSMTACRAIHQYSGGLPRQINLLCDNALLLGYAIDRHVIDRADIETVARDLRLDSLGHQQAQRQVAKRSTSTTLRHYVRRLVAGLALTIVVLCCLAASSRHDWPVNAGRLFAFSHKLGSHLTELVSSRDTPSGADSAANPQRGK